MMRSQNRRLLIFNLRTDADDPILGFTTHWARALASHYDAVDILTMHAGRLDLPANTRVFSAGRELGLSRPARLARFQRLLAGLLRRHRYAAAFAHMTPLFAGLAGPLLRPEGVQLVLWVTHRQVSWQLRLGLAMSDRVVTAVPSSFPLRTSRLRPLGHGIDTTYYTPGLQSARGSASDMPVVIYVARITPIKHQMTLLAAIQDLPVRVQLVGGIPDGYDEGYQRAVHQRVADLGLSDRVTLTGNQPREQVRALLQAADIAVNLSPPGLFDKAALESMACGLPTITANAAFDPLAGTRASDLRIASPEDSAGLRLAIAKLAGLPARERQAIGASQRAAVLEGHSLDRLITRLVGVLDTGEIPSESPHADSRYTGFNRPFGSVPGVEKP
jgi:glycosyltransferase involved in cell wall biosynthesis